MFINIIDATVVNVALPTIARTFGVPVDQTATINIGFLVAVAVAIPAAGWLGDRLGAREVFVLALALFTLASAACGLAQSVTELVIFRVAQGAAGGLMTPVGMAMLYRTFPPSERVRLGRITTIPIAFAPAIGPVLGGFLTENVGWRWIFGINVPIGIAAVTFTLLAVRPLPRTTTNRLDVAGFLLAGAGFALLMYALAEGPSHGWTSPEILLPGLIGLASAGRAGVRRAARAATHAPTATVRPAAVPFREPDHPGVGGRLPRGAVRLPADDAGRLRPHPVGSRSADVPGGDRDHDRHPDRRQAVPPGRAARLDRLRAGARDA